MNHKSFGIVLATLLSCNVYAQTQSPACSGNDASGSLERVSAKYKQAFEENAARYKEEGQRIEGETPNTDGPDAYVNMDVDVSMKRVDFSLSLPEITMKSQSLSMDVPTLESRRQEYSMDVPVTWMAQQCVPGPPEVVCRTTSRMRCVFGACTKIPEVSCSTRAGRNICTEVPQFKMETRKAALDTPVVVMKPQGFVLGVPQVSMALHKYALDVPQITVRNINAEVRQQKQDAEALSERADSETASLQESMRAEVAASTAQAVDQVFSCHISEIEQQRGQALSKIDSQIATVQAARDAAAKNNAAELLESFDKALADLVQAKQTTVDQFARAIEQLRASQATQIQERVAPMLSSSKS